MVHESPSWLQSRRGIHSNKASAPIATVFRPPYLKLTIIGILLGAVPLLGGWGSLNWLIPWADQYRHQEGLSGIVGKTQFMRSTGATIGSLLGGWLANMYGRRTTYFCVSLSSPLISGYIFWNLTPDDPTFTYWAFLIGMIATIAFGWLPLYLPELFPTHIRATGSGVTFNFGRFLAAAGVLGTGALTGMFNGNYAYVGRVTHLIFAVGMIVILFAPDTSQRRMDE
jgi:MFS family permease